MFIEDIKILKKRRSQNRITHRNNQKSIDNLANQIFRRHSIHQPKTSQIPHLVRFRPQDPFPALNKLTSNR